MSDNAFGLGCVIAVLTFLAFICWLVSKASR